tara:strand:+ start:117 stop:695 length:579 start_codon:yes stop_codon:yes gene_type:complete
MLGLGSSINTSAVKAGESDSYPSKVLFERSGNWSSGDTSIDTYRADLSIGTTEVGGISNYLIMEMNSSYGHTGDPRLRLSVSDLSRNPADYYDGNAGGDFKVTAKALYPSGNSGTVAGALVKAMIASNSESTSFGTADTWVTVTFTRATEASDPDSDSTFFEVRFDDNNPSQDVVVGDQMYLTDLKVEFIAD